MCQTTSHAASLRMNATQEVITSHAAILQASIHAHCSCMPGKVGCRQRGADLLSECFDQRLHVLRAIHHDTCMRTVFSASSMLRTVGVDVTVLPRLAVRSVSWYSGAVNVRAESALLVIDVLQSETPHKVSSVQAGTCLLPWPPGTKSATKSLGSTSCTLTELFSLSMASSAHQHTHAHCLGVPIIVRSWQATAAGHDSQSCRNCNPRLLRLLLTAVVSRRHQPQKL